MAGLRGVFGGVMVAVLALIWSVPAVAATAAATTTTMSSDVNPSVNGQAVTLRVLVAGAAGSGTPTGSVVFADGDTTLATVTLDSSGRADFSTSTLAVGTHNLTASYGGDGGHAASQGSLSQAVDRALTRLVVDVVSPASSGRFSAQVQVEVVAPGAGVPTGTVTYLEGDQVIATSQRGSGSNFTLNLPPGLHRVVAQYSGDGNFLPSEAVVIDGLVGQGYRLVAADGGLFSYGSAPFFGSLGGTPLNAPIVGGATTLDSRGYWMVGRDGGVFTFGDAPFYGAGLPDSVGMEAGRAGYAVLRNDGHFFLTTATAGAAFAGPTGVTAPFVGIAGDWSAGADGGVFTLAGGPFYGSAAGLGLKSPIVGIAATPTGNGYWLVASDGGVFSFGDAGFFGSMGGHPLNKPVVGMAPTSSGKGYWLVASDGGVFTFGDARFLGSRGGAPLNQPIVAVLAA